MAQIGREVPADYREERPGGLLLVHRPHRVTAEAADALEDRLPLPGRGLRVEVTRHGRVGVRPADEIGRDGGGILPGETEVRHPGVAKVRLRILDPLDEPGRLYLVADPGQIRAHPGQILEALDRMAPVAAED